MVDFRMPSLGADMEAGTLVEWLVKPGDQVKRGDVVAVVETQKGAIEIEVFETGRVEQILVDLNNKVPVGTPLARIRTELEDKAGVAAAAPLAPVIGVAATVPSAVPAARRPVTQVTAVPIVSGAGLRARASPAARQLAQSHHVDLAKMTGSGPDGAIVRADVERHLGAPALSAEKKRPTGLDLDAMRTAIAAAMARSKREIPHYYLQHQVDVTPCEQWLARTNATRAPDARLLLAALAIKCVGLAARRFSAFNGYYRNGSYESIAAVTCRGGDCHPRRRIGGPGVARCGPDAAR